MLNDLLSMGVALWAIKVNFITPLPYFPNCIIYSVSRLLKKHNMTPSIHMVGKEPKFLVRL